MTRETRPVTVSCWLQGRVIRAVFLEETVLQIALVLLFDLGIAVVVLHIICS